MTFGQVTEGFAICMVKSQRKTNSITVLSRLKGILTARAGPRSL